jgi:hypothetical protein
MSLFILETPPPTQAPITTQKPVVTTQKGIIQRYYSIARLENCDQSLSILTLCY